MRFDIGDEVIYTSLLDNARGTIIGIIRADLANVIGYKTVISTWIQNHGLEINPDTQLAFVAFNKPIRPCTFQQYCDSHEIELSEIYRPIYEKQVAPVAIQIAPTSVLDIYIEEKIEIDN